MVGEQNPPPEPPVSAHQAGDPASVVSPAIMHQLRVRNNLSLCHVQILSQHNLFQFNHHLAMQRSGESDVTFTM